MSSSTSAPSGTVAKKPSSAIPITMVSLGAIMLVIGMIFLFVYYYNNPSAAPKDCKCTNLAMQALMTSYIGIGLGFSFFISSLILYFTRENYKQETQKTIVVLAGVFLLLSLVITGCAIAVYFLADSINSCAYIQACSSTYNNQAIWPFFGYSLIGVGIPLIILGLILFKLYYDSIIP